MRDNLSHIDEQIRSRLQMYSQAERNYWSFRTGAVRDCMHACFQYPGMMVPQMQERLINTIIEAVPSARSVYEPFVGSGTVMIEVMKRGLDFCGHDINPLAILLCRAKSGPFYDDAIESRVNEILNSIKTDRKIKIEADFPKLSKWFNDDVAVELSKIRRAIRKERYLWCRRFYWMSLAETVRLSSNTRPTTFKLHARAKEESGTWNISPIKIFATLLRKNLQGLASQKKLLQARDVLSKGRYTGKLKISLKDSSMESTSRGDEKLHDLLITSPPYGDNRSTVSYGQYSYLPLQWIDLEDIDGKLDKTLLATAYEIDNRSLGGKLRRAVDDISELMDISISLKRILQKLKYEPRDRQLRVAAFWRDLNRCIKPILASLKEDAYMVWIVGNRRVAGYSIPMDNILSELLTSQGATFVESIQRIIPRKRMANKNNISATMGSETILIMRKIQSMRAK